MAKSVRTVSTRNRMSSVVSGDTRSRAYGGATPKGRTSVSAISPYRSPGLGMPVAGLGANVKSRKAITDRVTPAGAMIDIRGYLGDERTGIRKSVPGTRAPVVAAAPAAKPPVKKAPAVVSNVVREKPTPAKAAAPARKAVSARTGDTTGITTGKTTGTTARVGGVATKTSQSAYGRQMANAARRGNQPAGPMGGGGRSGSGGSSRPSGGGNLGGARGRIGEPGGSKR